MRFFLFRRERFSEEANASGQEDEEIQQKRNDHLTGFAEGEHRAGIESSHSEVMLACCQRKNNHERSAQPVCPTLTPPSFNT